MRTVASRKAAEGSQEAGTTKWRDQGYKLLSANFPLLSEGATGSRILLPSDRMAAGPPVTTKLECACKSVQLKVEGVPTFQVLHDCDANI